MNIARGYSNTASIPVPGYAINYMHLMYRNFANGLSSGYEGIVGITDNGGPVQQSDIAGVLMTNAAGNDIVANATGYYHITVMRYDCTSGTCTQSGPIDDAGAYSLFATLPQDTYNVEIEMLDGQVLTAGRDYAGQVLLPYVDSTSMQAQWIGSDLELSWTAPTGDANWNEVDQLRIVVFDNNNQTVLQIRLAPGDTSVIIPAALVSQSATLLGGVALAQWQIQTLAYDDNGMNIARGYSNKSSLP